MNIFSVILGFQITTGLLEIIIFQLGAVILGFSIHFFWSRKSLFKEQMSAQVDEPGINEADEWKLKYYEAMDLHEKQQNEMLEDLADAKQNENMLSIELDQLKEELANLKSELEKAEIKAAPEEYLLELKSAREEFFSHNEKIARLLEHIDILKESEIKHLDTLKENESLKQQIEELRKSVGDKETEFKQMRRQQLLASEMKERLDNAYGEFNGLQDKLQKLELQLSRPQSKSYEYEELQQAYFKLTKEFDELKLKKLSIIEENHRLSRILADTEDKLRESNFQRQQLLKKVNFLDELTLDLQKVTSHNKKLEGQLRRLGEIDNLLAGLSDYKKEDTSQSGLVQ